MVGMRNCVVDIIVDNRHFVNLLSAFTTIRTNLNVNFIVTTVVKSTLEHLYILIGDRIKSNDEIPVQYLTTEM
ncbi:hypothetical protein RDWZM_005043 [Blomia tropicalis]|uniref:Uncharacterized protein n=1 Tax=Blomia tropicalis TaxID=40697 RepID=A0A9Q0RM07_BLOTA|nr:hypothetical protein RDWZM_005043 [Blomia tropicalis]